jgi:hypothetical protein
MKKLLIIVFCLLSLTMQAQFKAGRHFGFDTLENGRVKSIRNTGLLHNKLFVSYIAFGEPNFSTVVFDGNRVIAKWPFEVRVVHLVSGEYIIVSSQTCAFNITNNSSFYCWSEISSGSYLFKVSSDFELIAANHNLFGGQFHQLLETQGQLFAMYDPMPNTPNQIEAYIYRLIDTTWVRQCNFVFIAPRQAIAMYDTVYNLGPYILPPNSCPRYREYMYIGADSTSRNIFGPFYAILENDTIFHSVEFDESTLGIGVTSFQPNYTRPPDFIPIHQRNLPSELFNFWKAEQFVHFRSGYFRQPGHPLMQSSPLYVLENFKRGTRIFPIAVSEYDSSNFAGRLLDTAQGVSNRIVGIPAQSFAGFVIMNDTLYLPGYPCTAPAFGTLCEGLTSGYYANTLYYIPVNTIMDSLGINRIVTRTRPKQQTRNPNWRLYPNPANEQLQVAGLEPGERFTLINSQGKQVGSLGYPAKNMPINHLPKGMYVGVWQGAAGVKMEKVVVE